MTQNLHETAGRSEHAHSGHVSFAEAPVVAPGAVVAAAAAAAAVGRYYYFVGAWPMEYR